MSDKTNRAAEIETAIRRRDAEGDIGEKLDKLLSCFDSLAKGQEGMVSRLDALEAAGKGAKDDMDAMPGDPAELAADSNHHRDRHTTYDKIQSELADIQARADQVSSAFGESAPRALTGEKPLDYRRRLLRPFKHHSKQFKDIDLNAVTDPKVFDAIETTIYADALAGSRTPHVDAGRLRSVASYDETGRRTINWYGSPSAWLNKFSGSRMAVTAISRKSAL